MDIERQRYRIGDREIDPASPDFRELVSAAHRTIPRPRCLCTEQEPEMYVARQGHGFVLKRMPMTGSAHAVDCPAYEIPADQTGLGPLLGSAVREDPDKGCTTLRCAFTLARGPARQSSQPQVVHAATVKSPLARLTLRGLLHYLWDQAELTRWHPGFEGRRTWAVVRRHLLSAAEGKFVGLTALSACLYIPEPGVGADPAQREERRNARWRVSQDDAAAGRRRQILIAEVKEIGPARSGFRVLVEHVPDLAFLLDDAIHRRTLRRFDGELSLWGASDAVRLLVIATFSVNTAGLPVVHELSLMPTTECWIPIEDEPERALIDRLVRTQRRFVKGLRYDLPETTTMPAAFLTDLPDGSQPLYA